MRESDEQELVELVKEIHQLGLLQSERITELQLLGMRGMRLSSNQGQRLAELVQRDDLETALRLARSYRQHARDLLKRTESHLANLSALLDGLEVDLRQVED